MAVNINILNAGNTTIGSNEPQQSPYFIYDSNRNIIGLLEAAPNVPYIYDEEIAYWHVPVDNLYESYATGLISFG